MAKFLNVSVLNVTAACFFIASLPLCAGPVDTLGGTFEPQPVFLKSVSWNESPGCHTTSKLDKSLDSDPFLFDVWRRVNRYWSHSGGLSKQPIVGARIHSDGTVSAVRLFQSSGQPALDASAINAVKSANPFHCLPVGFPESIDVQVRFQNTNSAVPGKQIGTYQRSETDTTRDYEKEISVRLIGEARSDFAAKRISEGIVKLHRACEVSPSDQETRIALANGFLQWSRACPNDPRQQMPLLREALYTDTTCDGAFKELMELMRKSGNNPLSSEAHLELARAARANREYSSAAIEYWQAQLIHSDNALYREISQFVKEQSSGRFIAEQLEELKINDTAERRIRLGQAYRDAGDNASAKQQFEKAVELNPMFESANEELRKIGVEPKPIYH